MQLFKKLMTLRKTTSNELTKNLVGYDTEKRYIENIRRAEQRWTKRKVLLIKVTMNLLNTDDKPAILSLPWNMLW